MNITEAQNLLELSSTATPEEAKKRYFELAKKYHPDVNKEQDAEDKFKKINEAYQIVSTGKGTDREESPQRQSRNNNPFGDIFGKQTIQIKHIELKTTISFKDSIFGCKRDLQFKRQGKCQNCDGEGSIKINNGCSKCGGEGQITIRRGNMIFSQTCDGCFGKSQVNSCTTCSESGHVNTDVSVNVTVPGGIQNSNILKLNGMGNYIGSMFGNDQYSDVYLRVTVTQEDGLSLDGINVVSRLELSLLEALQGCNKNIKTILGEQKILVKPLSKNNEEVIIPNLGVNRIGNQRVILDVKYPDDVTKLLSVLTEEV